jgi:hypothetical protein
MSIIFILDIYEAKAQTFIETIEICGYGRYYLDNCGPVDLCVE